MLRHFSTRGVSSQVAAMNAFSAAAKDTPMNRNAFVGFCHKFRPSLVDPSNWSAVMNSKEQGEVDLEDFERKIMEEIYFLH